MNGFSKSSPAFVASRSPPRVHLLHGVGSVVEPLPDEGEADDLAVAGEHGEVAGAEGLHVALHEIGVRGLTELLVIRGMGDEGG